jgi:hypothetical protein
MGYGYRPKDPRAKLREVVAGYVQSMRVAGRKPNAGVVFGESSDGAVPQTEGFLVEDRRSGRRYLLLEDGDVLHDPQESWLAEPDDELVTLLARSLADARMGGSGWLAGDEVADDPQHVPDRRDAQRPHGGPERRS